MEYILYYYITILYSEDTKASVNDYGKKVQSYPSADQSFSDQQLVIPGAQSWEKVHAHHAVCADISSWIEDIWVRAECVRCPWMLA